MFEVLKSRITAWKRYSRTVSELNALTNRELSDLGISRSDIQRVAREGPRKTKPRGARQAPLSLLQRAAGPPCPPQGLPDDPHRT